MPTTRPERSRSRSRRATAIALTVAAIGPVVFGLALAQEKVSPIARDLPAEQLEKSLVRNHPISLPSPPELLYVLSKQGSPKWRNHYNKETRAQETDRSKTALQLGFRLAEGQLGAMARDAQKIRDVTTDLQRNAKLLGIGDGLAESAREVHGLADQGAWPAIAYQLEVLREQARESLISQRDPDLAQLINFGQWLRLLQVSSAVVTEEDFKETSIAISSNACLAQIEKMLPPAGADKSELLKFLRDGTAKLRRMWAPEKHAADKVFGDAVIRETNERITGMIRHCTK